MRSFSTVCQSYNPFKGQKRRPDTQAEALSTHRSKASSSGGGCLPVQQPLSSLVGSEHVHPVSSQSLIISPPIHFPITSHVRSSSPYLDNPRPNLDDLEGTRPEALFDFFRAHSLARAPTSAFPPPL